MVKTATAIKTTTKMCKNRMRPLFYTRIENIKPIVLYRWICSFVVDFYNNIYAAMLFKCNAQGFSL